MDTFNTPVDASPSNPTMSSADNPSDCNETNKTVQVSSRDDDATPPKGTVRSRIQLFDRTPPPKPPTLIEQRKEQLSNKWGLDATKKMVTKVGVCGRTGKPVEPSKVEWHASPKSRVYKKRVLASDE